MLTSGGLVLLIAFVLVANSINKRKSTPPVNGARIFIWFWLVVSIINFCVGVFIAGYSVMSEIIVHIFVFGLPAGIAWYLSRRFRSKVRLSNASI
jgi:apolipoprotein N-acyltransferase